MFVYQAILLASFETWPLCHSTLETVKALFEHKDSVKFSPYSKILAFDHTGPSAFLNHSFKNRHTKELNVSAVRSVHLRFSHKPSSVTQLLKAYSFTAIFPPTLVSKSFTCFLPKISSKIWQTLEAMSASHSHHQDQLDKRLRHVHDLQNQWSPQTHNVPFFSRTSSHQILPCISWFLFTGSPLSSGLWACNPHQSTPPFVLPFNYCRRAIITHHVDSANLSAFMFSFNSHVSHTNSSPGTPHKDSSSLYFSSFFTWLWVPVQQKRIFSPQCLQYRFPSFRFTNRPVTEQVSRYSQSNLLVKQTQGTCRHSSEAKGGIDE